MADAVARTPTPDNTSGNPIDVLAARSTLTERDMMDEQDRRIEGILKYPRQGG